ncbi:MAG: M3 family metallopeptidase, partial [Deinococcota bacterium]
MNDSFIAVTSAADTSTATPASAALPHWQLESIYPSLESEAWTKANSELDRLMDAFKAYCDTLPPDSTKAADSVTTFETGFRQWLELRMLSGKMMGYLSLTLATDAFNDAAQAERSRLGTLFSSFSVHHKAFMRWLGKQDVDYLSEHSALALDHYYMLHEVVVYAEHMMDVSAEGLESALAPTAAVSWMKLYNDIISKQTVVASIDSDPREYALSELINFSSHTDAKVRKRAYDTEMALFSKHDIAIGACLNSIKGHVNTLTARRGWQPDGWGSEADSALAEALFDNAITKKSLDAMQQACQAAFPMFRRYLKAKAKLLGKSTLDWYDINAPIASAPPHYSWQDAQDFVTKHFASYSDDLAQFAQKVFDNHWIDVPPRQGKTSGAFCSRVMSERASRILLNFGGTLDDLFTLAHELGHGYHNDCMYRFER